MNNTLTIAQISDSHLFANSNALHCGVNVYQNLLAVLSDIAQNKSINYLIFTGDLTQDHSEQSYQFFAQAVIDCQLSIPVYFLAGNHDEPRLLKQYLTAEPFCQSAIVDIKGTLKDKWQLMLLDSKSATPAGYFDAESIVWLEANLDSHKSQLLFMHHHPINVGYFIDKHGLKNSEEFWQTLAKYPSIQGIACGHIHRGLTLLPDETKRSTVVYTCPATSIQFDPLAPTVSALRQGPGYRVFTLTANGEISSTLRYLD